MPFEFKTNFTRKNARGWYIDSQAVLKDDLKLIVSTFKAYGNALTSSMQVVEIENGMQVHRMYRDFSNTLYREVVRVTQQAAEEQHGRALVAAQRFEEAIRKQYGLEEGRKVPEGWQIVPIDPTLEMWDALQGVSYLGAVEAYKNVLAAAPEYKP
jgi:hypothetical protein